VIELRNNRDRESPSCSVKGGQQSRTKKKVGQAKELAGVSGAGRAQTGDPQELGESLLLLLTMTGGETGDQLQASRLWR
jgi:hypothetical protein